MSTTDGTGASNAPFQKLTSNNHGPAIIVTAFIFLITSVLAVSVKLWTRISTTRKLVLTDFAVILSILFAVAQTIAVTVAVNHGLGRHADAISNSDLEAASKAYYASNILLIVAVAGAKASVTTLIIAIKPARPVMLCCYGVLAVVAVWTVAAMLALAFQCSMPEPWVLGPNTALGPRTCVNQYALQIGIGAVNILTDLVIVALPFFMMQVVQVASTKRWMVSALFALRIATPAFAICALVTFHTFYHSDPQDRPWHIVGPAIWTQVMLNISIITACIPSIKRFLADIQSGLMGVNISEPYELTHSGGKYVTYGRGTSFGSKVATRLGISNVSASGNGHNTSSLSKSRNEKNIDIERNGTHLSPGRMNMNTSRAHADRTTKESESVKGLTDDVIMQTIDYKVEYEDGNTEGSDEGRSSRSGNGHGHGHTHSQSQGGGYGIGVGR